MWRSLLRLGALCRYVWQLCDMVFFQCNLETPCIFRKAAPIKEKRLICDWLENPDSDIDVDRCGIHAYLAVFADFLMALEDPVIPRRLLPTSAIESAKLEVRQTPFHSRVRHRSLLLMFVLCRSCFVRRRGARSCWRPWMLPATTYSCTRSRSYENSFVTTKRTCLMRSTRQS